MNKVIVFIGLLLFSTVIMYGGEAKKSTQENFSQFKNYDEAHIVPVAGKSKEYKNNPYYQSFNFHRGLAIGFGVPGLILLTTPVLFGTVPLLIACSREGYNWSSIIQNEYLLIGLSYYVISIGIGAIFTTVAAINIVVASWHLKRWKKAGDSVSLALGYGEGPRLAVSYRF